MLGRTLFDRYHLEQVLGHSASGTLYLATDLGDASGRTPDGREHPEEHSKGSAGELPAGELLAVKISSLPPGEAEEERFYTAFEAAPCPALDPNSGACTVYAWRPVVCRTHGPPLRERDGDVAHCPLCFTDATSAEVDAARATLDVADMEAPLSDQVAHETGRRGMTTVTFAIADPSTVRRAGPHQTA